MKAILVVLFLSVLPIAPSAGQRPDPLIFAGLQAVKGSARYSAIDFGGGIRGRYQHPVAEKWALTAGLGLDLHRINSFFLVPTSYLGYGYNPISGFGFNTLYYNFYGYEYRVTAVSIPIQVGPRWYVSERVHADLMAGVDLAVNRHAVSAPHIEPGAGYLLPLKVGGFLDLTAGYFTTFARGRGAFTVGVAYGFRRNRAR
ncbi:hypothetical protein [Larkinella soli]|uniref:hypothetical protein n=1 Tax=Larkinella soli TaxID=1770527 RepID=UPI000FFBC083|nr:hypothetical protein [Larkinella soli]